MSVCACVCGRGLIVSTILIICISNQKTEVQMYNIFDILCIYGFLCNFEEYFSCLFHFEFKEDN